MSRSHHLIIKDLVEDVVLELDDAVTTVRGGFGSDAASGGGSGASSSMEDILNQMQASADQSMQFQLELARLNAQYSASSAATKASGSGAQFS